MSDQQICSTQDDAPTRHNATDRLNVPLMAFAGELIRLAEVVKRNLETGASARSPARGVQKDLLLLETPRAISSVGRALRSHRRSRGIEARIAH